MGILMWIGIGIIVSVFTLTIEVKLNHKHIPFTFVWELVGAICEGVFATAI